MKRLLAIALSLTVLLSAAPLGLTAEGETENTQPVTVSSGVDLDLLGNRTEPAYADLRGSYEFPVYSGADITMALDAALSADGQTELTVTLDVPSDGLYEIALSYQNAAEQILATELMMTLDGEIPFYELRRLRFESLWLSSGVPQNDRYGNEIASLSLSSGAVLEKSLDDSSYRTADPFLFRLTRGSHRLTLSLSDGAITLHSLILRAPQSVPEYSPGEADGSQLLIYEGEKYSSANTSTVHAAGEYSPALTPYDANTRLINFLDDASLAKAGTRVDYTIDVSESGWYYLGFVYRQAAKSHFPVFCDILIDGQLPSTAAQTVEFPYATNFSEMTVAAPDGSNQRFWLEQGTHTLSLIVNTEPMLEIYSQIEQLITDISSLTMEVTRLTGGVTTDKYRDYKLDDYIPGLGDMLYGWAEQCESMIEHSMLYTDRLSSTFSSLRVAANILRKLAKEPEDLPQNIKELIQSGSSVMSYLSQTMQDMDNNALGIDRIFVYQQQAKLPTRPGVFASFWESVKRFFISFVRSDYSVTSVNQDNLQVWMARPRQYVELLQNLIDTRFTPETGIGVDLSIMPDASKLALSEAAGKAPDVALSVGYVLPSYLSIRGALYDLKQFDSFQEVARRFPEGLFIPGISEGGVYAIPETINFWVMFYRIDILEALGIPIPDNMNEVKAILPELQRRSMNFFYPTAAMLGMKTFPATIPLIAQSNGSVFGDTIADVQLDSDAVLAGFRELTDLMNVYNLPLEVPDPGFYQQFRSGTLPIGISDVSTYNLLLNSAPELSGLWSIALFPGLLDENGDVLRYTTGGAESDMIFRSTDRPDDAWAFLEWWSSTEIQALFGSNLQSLYGGTFLWNTANSEAFIQLPLKSAHKRVIMEQTKWMIEVPWIPGTYMVERELSNAYSSVVVGGVAERRAMDSAIKRIDREIARKLEEFGYTKDGETVREFTTPTVSDLWEAD